MSPGGNTTLLVLSIPASAAKRTAIANELMDTLHLGAEQVGFVDMTTEVPRLEMMGGEFCGNAARSLAALLAFEHHTALVPAPEQPALLRGVIDVSGVGAHLGIEAQILAGPHGPLAEASVEMPVSPSPQCCQAVEDGLDIVQLEGITHILLDSARHPMPGDVKSVSAAMRRQFGLEHCDAVGCIWYQQKGEGFSIDPVVWVRETQTTYHETACGSGTVALGLRQALLYGTGFDGSILQPSGQAIKATVTLTSEGTVEGAWIGGPVRLIASGETYLFSA